MSRSGEILWLGILLVLAAIGCDGECNNFDYCDGATLVLQECDCNHTNFGDECKTDKRRRECEFGCVAGNCILSDEVCPEGVTSFCSEGDIWNCVESSPVSRSFCSDNEYCVDSPTLKEAQCSRVRGSCNNGERYCLIEKDNSHFSICEDEIYKNLYSCHDSTACQFVEGANGQMYGGCFLLDSELEACPDGIDAMCMGDVAVSCVRTGYPEVLLFDECSYYNNPYCMEFSGGSDRDPDCVISEEPCEAGVEKMCLNNWIVDCTERGYPIGLYECPVYEPCGVREDGVIDCVQ